MNIVQIQPVDAACKFVWISKGQKEAGILNGIWNPEAQLQ